jgi:hypothetical protein
VASTTLQLVAARKYTQDEEDLVGCGKNKISRMLKKISSFSLKQKGWKLDMGMRNTGVDFGLRFYGHHPS